MRGAWRESRKVQALIALAGGELLAGGAASGVEPMAESGYEAVAAVLPEVDRQGRYFWQSFAERLQGRFEGLPATDGTGSFVDECLRAGAEAVPVARRNTLWQKDAPDRSRTRARGIYELRIRLGLFYAGQPAVPGAWRVAAAGDVRR